MGKLAGASAWGRAVTIRAFSRVISQVMAARVPVPGRERVGGGGGGEAPIGESLEKFEENGVRDFSTGFQSFFNRSYWGEQGF